MRTFWINELRDFTRCVVANIAVIGRLINMPMQIRPYANQQVKSGRSQVDMLARRENGDPIVIEFQVMPADDEHWRRLEKYHASHGARTFIWIAESFDEKILAVLKEWNARADAPFKVFAIALRVPTWAGGQVKPYFEVMARPPGDEALSAIPDVAACVGELHPSAELWAALLTLRPDEARRSRPWRQHIRLRRKTFVHWQVAMGVFDDEVGIWLYCSSTNASTNGLEVLRPYANLLEARLDVRLDGSSIDRIAFKTRAIGAGEARDLGSAVEWLYEQTNVYEAALREYLALIGERPANSAR